MRFGVQDDAQLRAGNFAGLDAGKRIGARAVRVIVPAADIRRRPGNYDFSTYDRIVDGARARGIRPQLVLDTARGFTHGADPHEFASFAAAAAQHFKGRVQRYSLINEPDLRMTPKMYRQLYQRGRAAVKRHDNGAQILFGEFSPKDPAGYARRVVGRKGLRAEGVAWHPYQATTDPLAPGAPKGGIGRLGQVTHDLARLNLRTAHGRAPGAFLTEFGYKTRGPDAISPQQAAAFWPRAVRKAQRAGARQLIAYQVSEEPNPGSPWDTSLVDSAGNPRPAYGALLRSVMAGRTKR